MLTYADFIVYHPSFTTTDLEVQGKISRMLASLARCFPLEAWEDDQSLADQALMLFVCHLLTIDSMRSSTEGLETDKGAVKKISIFKKVETEYFQSGSLDLSHDLLDQTSCGRELKALDDSVFRVWNMVVGPGIC